MDFEFENTEFDVDSGELWDQSTEERVTRLYAQAEKIVRDKKVFRKFLSKQYNRVRDIEELTRLPGEQEQIRIITQKSFNAYAILLYVVENVNVDECYLTTYNMDKNTISGLEALCESGNIGDLTIVISDSVNFRMPDRAEELKEITKKYKNIHVIFAWNHTKIIAAKTKKGCYVIEGSGNLSDNARVEQYLIEQCRETYDFHKEWIETLKTENYKRLEYYE